MYDRYNIYGNCGISVLHNLPEYMSLSGIGKKEKPSKTFITQVKRHIKQTKEENKAMLIITLNSNQSNFVPVLKELGFKETPWVDRPMPSRKLKLLGLYLGEESEEV